MLNLDELLGTPKVIRWGGTEYPVLPVTLRVVLQAQKAMENVTDMKDAWAGMVSVLKEVVPGLDTENLPVKALEKVFHYVISEDGDENAPLPEAPTLPAAEDSN